ncbi:MAG: PilZ domain-containing protein [Myxococcota bacterium]
MSDERREFPRVGQNTHVKCRPLNDEGLEDLQGDGYTVNISGGGIGFLYKEYVKPGSHVALNLELPQFPSDVIALARVVWCEPTGDEEEMPYEIGAEFHWIGWESSSAQNQIATYIRDKLES